jgi:signal transduction histidine kinase
MVPTSARRDHQRIGHRRHPGPPWAPLCGAGWGRAHGPRTRDRGPIRRRSDERFLGGIAGGLSARTGLDPNLIRIGLVLFAITSVGVAAYVVAWLIVPVEGEDESIGSRALSDARGLALAVALVPVLVITLLLASALHAGFLGSMAWPLFIGAAGMVLIWRNGSPQERQLLRQATAPLMHLGSGARGTWKGLVGRVAVGLLVAAGGVWALAAGSSRQTLLRPLAGVALVLAAIVVVFGPWWLSVARELVLERQARLRAEERADLASRVHDSVLQTLAMIQRHAEEPQKVAQLARAQERELRSWLFEGQPPGSFADGLDTVAAAVRCIQTEVEAAHGVKVETVVVGDAPLTDNLEAVLAAAREAAVNAATWSGAEVISVFAEVEPEKVSLFVRDRGKGFDRTRVGPDRKGIAESIEGRMARHGGGASIRTAPGEGTEVALTMDRADRAGTARRGGR